MIGVLIVPTGIGAEIGGHAGDAGPVARLIGACCDKLILHPNVVNGSDINEMPDNALYVEGSILDRFLRGEVGLGERRHNRILVVANRPVLPCTVNAVSASRATAGVTAEVVGLDTPLVMRATMYDGRAGGTVTGVEELVSQLRGHDFDALAVHSPIEVERPAAIWYLRHGGTNPWGAVEAIASRMIASALDKPVAHAPIENAKPDDRELLDMASREIVDPRMAAEVISTTYLHCVLKGLSRAPRLVKSTRGIWYDDVDFMVAPWGCYGPAHAACVERGIPIIEVHENRTAVDRLPAGIRVENYWEAAGVIMCMRAGIGRGAVRRPLGATQVTSGESSEEEPKREYENVQCP